MAFDPDRSSCKGRPISDRCRIIKHKLCLSDAETVQQIQENPYLQYFVGLSGYQKKAPFASSLFVDTSVMNLLILERIFLCFVKTALPG
jgi:hypothetical protein